MAEAQSGGLTCLLFFILNPLRRLSRSRRADGFVGPGLSPGGGSRGGAGIVGEEAGAPTPQSNRTGETQEQGNILLPFYPV